MYKSFLNKLYTRGRAHGKGGSERGTQETRKMKGLIATADSLFIYLWIKITITQVTLA